jgi:hypothetical protein
MLLAPCHVVGTHVVDAYAFVNVPAVTTLLLILQLESNNRTIDYRTQEKSYRCTALAFIPK